MYVYILSITILLFFSYSNNFHPSPQTYKFYSTPSFPSVSPPNNFIFLCLIYCNNTKFRLILLIPKMFIAPKHHFPSKELTTPPLSTQENSSRNNNNQATTQIAVSSIQFVDDFSTPLEQQIKIFKAPTLNNAANIFRVKQTNTNEKKDKLTYIRYQNYTSARNRKTTQQKIYEINNFVKKLTQNINKEDEIPDISDTKFRALKKIIEYYDIKNLDKSEYLNVIKSFGLQIGGIDTKNKSLSSKEEKKTDLKKFKPISQLINQTEKKIKIKQLQEQNLSSTQRSFNSNFQGMQICALTKLSIHQRIDKKQEEKQEKRSNLFSSLQMRKQSKFKENSTKKHLKFSNIDNIIKEKINKFRQFLFALNFSNRLYRNLNIEKYTQHLKYYVGRGNNGNLIRSLMKKRFWFEEVHQQKDANFIWTQIKLPEIFMRQSQVQEQEPAVTKVPQKKFTLKAIFNKSDPLLRILTLQQYKEIHNLYDTIKNRQSITFDERVKYCHTRNIKVSPIQETDIIHNHLPGNGLLGNKKAMFYCLREYYNIIGENVFDVVPLTFIINQGLLDPEYNAMAVYFNEKKSKKKPNFWILKPGQFSNRGNGIQCTNKLQDIRKRINKCMKEKKKRSIIVQEYMNRPLLYNGRKFDIRTYMIITYHNGKTKAYWYQDGYVRTSSHFFSLDEMGDTYIHLTNDAVQKHSENYGRFQEGNKLSYPELQRYLDTLPANGRNLNFHEAILPQMKNIAGNSVKSTFLSLNAQKKDKNFELFGFDFMIDQNFKPWLIEINTNPCLQLSSPVLQRLIPYLVQNTLRITLDSIFPPPNNFSNNYKYNIPENSLHYNKFQMIFDSERDGKALVELYKNRNIFNELHELEQEKNEYHQEGEMINIDDL